MQSDDDMVILVAEDNANDLVLLKHALAQGGIPARLHIARDGEEVRRYLLGEGVYGQRDKYPFPDLLLLDLKMPKMTGLDVLRWLKDNPRCVTLPKVMMSGSGLDKDIEEAYRLGVHTYFQKPDTLASLKELLQSIVQYWSRSQRPFSAELC